MNLEILEESFSICKIKNLKDIDVRDPFFFLAKTDEELSLVCTTTCVPEYTVERKDNYKGIRIQGTLDFSLVGILAHITGILATEEISVFAVSTYNTDYLFIEEKQFYAALKALGNEGYDILVF